jgi:ABC-type Mn2+/Zn2+ transport system ATPase subunit
VAGPLTGARRETVEGVIAQAGLESVIRRKAGAYSMGMRLRLAITAALPGDPPVLILDEPFNGVDPKASCGCAGTCARWPDRAAVVVSSHVMNELEDALTTWWCPVMNPCLPLISTMGTSITRRRRSVSGNSFTVMWRVRGGPGRRLPNDAQGAEAL